MRKLIATLLENFWETCYPLLDRDENDDPIERMNVLANLSPDHEQSYGSTSTEALMRTLRGTVIAESREVGRFTVRDLDYVLGRMTPPEGQTAPSEGLLAAAWNTADAEANSKANTEAHAGADVRRPGPRRAGHEPREGRLVERRVHVVDRLLTGRPAELHDR